MASRKESAESSKLPLPTESTPSSTSSLPEATSPLTSNSEGSAGMFSDMTTWTAPLMAALPISSTLTNPSTAPSSSTGTWQKSSALTIQKPSNVCAWAKPSTSSLTNVPLGPGPLKFSSTNACALTEVQASSSCNAYDVYGWPKHSTSTLSNEQLWAGPSTSNAFTWAEPPTSLPDNTYAWPTPKTTTSSNAFTWAEPPTSLPYSTYACPTPITTSSSNAFTWAEPPTSLPCSSYACPTPITTSSSNAFSWAEPPTSLPYSTFAWTTPITTTSSNAFTWAEPPTSLTYSTYACPTPITTTSSNAFTWAEPPTSLTYSTYACPTPITTSSSNTLTWAEPSTSTYANKSLWAGPSTVSTSFPKAKPMLSNQFLWSGPSFDLTPNTSQSDSAMFINGLDSSSNLLKNSSYESSGFLNYNYENEDANTSAGSSSTVSAVCNRCDQQSPTFSCYECNKDYCQDCGFDEQYTCAQSKHTLYPNFEMSNTEQMNCETHFEPVTLCCVICEELICKKCQFYCHKEHRCIVIKNNLDITVLNDIKLLFQTSKAKSQAMKKQIDEATAMGRANNNNTKEVILDIKYKMQFFIETIQNREKFLLYQVEEMKQARTRYLSEYTIELNDIISHLSNAKNCLLHCLTTEGVEIEAVAERAKLALEFAEVISTPSPVEEKIIFRYPCENLLFEICRQSHLQRAVNTVYSSNSPFLLIPPPILLPPCIRPALNLAPGPPNSVRPSTSADRSIVSISHSLLRRQVGLGIGQSIPGYNVPVSFSKPKNVKPILSFAPEGSDAGKVSNSWGICIDKDGRFLVADRRNHRIQIFNSRGRLLHIFGGKGNGPGQFNLPVGITTDTYERIIIVDKDNHRIQIFSKECTFLGQFGKQGVFPGEFQYPWDVAVNSMGYIVVSDSRNYRVQMFSSTGNFITLYSFIKKDVPRCFPRGICFTITGNIVVSDFENGRLVELNSDISKVISYIRALGTTAFYRPSGLICDDTGNMILADAKNYRLVVLNTSKNTEQIINLQTPGFVNIRPHDVALTREGRVVVMFETLPSGFGPEPESVRRLYIKVY